MPSRETQALILKVALELFNEHRSASVSTNRIAEACEISKGNLNYHFRTKQDIILALFADITVEMNRAWYEDHRNPTMEHMAFMFVRQLRLIWRYRFFYREIIPLLRESKLLRRRFNEVRVRRVAEVKRFMKGLIAAGLFRTDYTDEQLDLLITSTWVLSDHWLNHIETTGQDVDEAAFRLGYDILVNMVTPYLTPTGLQALKRGDELTFLPEPIAPA
jgi:AcrR family transcriptional regulator